MISHEIWTPLAVISGEARRSLRRIDSEPRGRIQAAMEKCRTSVERLIRLIEEVLNISRLEARIPEFAPEPCPLAKIIKDVANNQQEFRASHRIRVDFDGCRTRS